jgi:hypothetical protein
MTLHDLKLVLYGIAMLCLYVCEACGKEHLLKTTGGLGVLCTRGAHVIIVCTHKTIPGTSSFVIHYNPWSSTVQLMCMCFLHVCCAPPLSRLLITFQQSDNVSVGADRQCIIGRLELPQYIWPLATCFHSMLWSISLVMSELEACYSTACCVCCNLSVAAPVPILAP